MSLLSPGTVVVAVVIVMVVMVIVVVNHCLGTYTGTMLTAAAGRMWLSIWK